MSDEELTTSEKKSLAAQERWNKNHHPLFQYAPGEKAEEISWISLMRQTERGPVDCPRVYPASELETTEDIQTFFGGGRYELSGQRAGTDGRPGAVVKKRRLFLPGDPKPFPGEMSEHPPAPAVVASSPDPMFNFMQMMAEERRAAEAREDRRMAREEQRQAQSQGIIAAAISGGVALVTAFLNRPAPPMPAPAPQGPDAAALFQMAVSTVTALIPKADADPLGKLAQVVELADKIRGPAQAEKTDSIGDLMGGLGQAMGSFAQLEELRQRAAAQGLPSPAPMPGTEEPPPAPAAHVPPAMQQANGQTDRAPPMPAGQAFEDASGLET